MFFFHLYALLNWNTLCLLRCNLLFWVFFLHFWVTFIFWGWNILLIIKSIKVLLCLNWDCTLWWWLNIFFLWYLNISLLWWSLSKLLLLWWSLNLLISWLPQILLLRHRLLSLVLEVLDASFNCFFFRAWIIWFIFIRDIFTTCFRFTRLYYVLWNIWWHDLSLLDRFWLSYIAVRRNWCFNLLLDYYNFLYDFWSYFHNNFLCFFFLWIVWGLFLFFSLLLMNR